MQIDTSVRRIKNIMAQFRLTDKFANDLKIPLEKAPESRLHPLDDWIADVFRLNRKKIALLTHVPTLLSFIFPYSEVGGAKNVLGFLPVEIESYLIDKDLEEWVESMKEVFNQPSVFTKTKNKKVLGHMNDFKKIIFYSRYYSHENPNWHEISRGLKEVLVNINGSFAHPDKLLIASLKSRAAY